MQLLYICVHAALCVCLQSEALNELQDRTWNSSSPFLLSFVFQKVPLSEKTMLCIPAGMKTVKLSWIEEQMFCAWTSVAKLAVLTESMATPGVWSFNSVQWNFTSTQSVRTETSRAADWRRHLNASPCGRACPRFYIWVFVIFLLCVGVSEESWPWHGRARCQSKQACGVSSAAESPLQQDVTSRAEATGCRASVYSSAGFTQTRSWKDSVFSL